jgi:hypothetical protein
MEVLREDNMMVSLCPNKHFMHQECYDNPDYTAEECPICKTQVGDIIWTQVDKLDSEYHHDPYAKLLHNREQIAQKSLKGALYVFHNIIYNITVNLDRIISECKSNPELWIYFSINHEELQNIDTLTSIATYFIFLLNEQRVVMTDDDILGNRDGIPLFPEEILDTRGIIIRYYQLFNGSMKKIQRYSEKYLHGIQDFFHYYKINFVYCNYESFMTIPTQ